MHEPDQALNSALEPHVGRRFVVKLGGEIMLNTAGLDALARDVVTLAAHGVDMVVVHGGGPQADALAARLGHSVRKVAGRRVTDDDALEVAKMVYGGSLNLEVLAAIRRAGGHAVGLSGVDAGLVNVVRRMPVRLTDPATGQQETVDFGHVGDVVSVDVTLLDLLLDRGYVPVVASLAADEQGNIYNVNADTVAQSLAVALRAEGLFLMTNVPGILRDPSDRSSLVAVCTPDEVNAMIASGAISGGMLPKVHNCLEAIRAGVGRVRILDGTGAESLLLASFLREGVGTTVVGLPV